MVPRNDNEATSDDVSLQRMAMNDEENAKSDVANAATSADAPSGVALAKKGDRKGQGVASTEMEDEPVDTKDEGNWGKVRTPLNLEATDSVASLAVSGGDAAQPWWNVRNTL